MNPRDAKRAYWVRAAHVVWPEHECFDYGNYLCVVGLGKPAHFHIYGDPLAPDFTTHQSQLNEAQAARFVQQCMVECVKARLDGELVG